MPKLVHRTTGAQVEVDDADVEAWQARGYRTMSAGKPKTAGKLKGQGPGRSKTKPPEPEPEQQQPTQSEPEPEPGARTDPGPGLGVSGPPPSDQPPSAVTRSDVLPGQQGG